MELYLDLKKAAQQRPPGSTATKKDPKAKRSNEESYGEHPVGVMGGGGSTSYDDPKVGKKWKHGEEDSVDEDLEEKRQAANKKAQDRNLLPKKEEVSMKKAIDSSSMDLVKSLNESICAHLNKSRLNPTEVQFLEEVLGYSQEDIQKGKIAIEGRDRQVFSEWLADRFQKSLDNLCRR